MAFLHGVETRNTEGSTLVTTADTSVIALTGTAPIGTGAELKLITSQRQALEVYGPDLEGFTIPAALESIFSQGPAKVIVANVFVAADHTEAVADEAVTVANGKFQLAEVPVGNIVVTNSGGTTTYVAGTHYSLAPTGVVTILDGTTIPNGTSLLVDYAHLDPTTITASVVNGTTSPRTGLELFDLALNQFGFRPGVFIAPTYCELLSVSQKMQAKAEAAGAVYLLDAPAATTVANALTSRGLASTVPTFQTTSTAAYLLYPYVKAVAASGDVVTRPLSPYAAGVIARSDEDNGFWFSPSNQQLKTVVGTATSLTFDTSSTTSDTNLLNAQGITTAANLASGGWRLWGNRNASFPGNTGAETFLAVYRVKRVLQLALERAGTSYLGRPITQAVIDDIKETANQYIRSLVGQGALISGSECIYDASANPPAQLAEGRLVFNVVYISPTSLERLTFDYFLDQSLLANLA